MALGVAVFGDLLALHLHLDFELKTEDIGKDVIDRETESKDADGALWKGIEADCDWTKSVRTTVTVD